VVSVSESPSTADAVDAGVCVIVTLLLVTDTTNLKLVAGTVTPFNVYAGCCPLYIPANLALLGKMLNAKENVMATATTKTRIRFLILQI
jgi:hypothetical protein